MKCSCCGEELVLGGDYTYKDFNISSGMVVNYNCQNDSCDVRMVLVYKRGENGNSGNRKASSPKKA